MSADVEAIKAAWLNQCGPCDAGLPMGCACPDADPRPVILSLVEEVERLRDVEAAREAFARGVAWANARLAAVEAERDFKADMLAHTSFDYQAEVRRREAAEARADAAEARVAAVEALLDEPRSSRAGVLAQRMIRAALANTTPSDAPHAPQDAGSAQVAPGDADGLPGAQVDGERDE